MNSHGPEPRDELLDVAEALYFALMGARPYVARCADPLDAKLVGAKVAEAVEALDRVDGALADAGELLPGRRG